MLNLTVFILVGAPGSGKSTWGKKFAENHDFELVCPDTFRAIHGKGEDDQSVSDKAFQSSFFATSTSLSKGKSVVVDATNLYPRARSQFIRIAKNFNASTECIVFEMDLESLEHRNTVRKNNGGRFVPSEIIQKMLSRYRRPTEKEVDKVRFVSRLSLYDGTEDKPFGDKNSPGSILPESHSATVS